MEEKSTILVVDDDVSLAKILLVLLQSKGYEVDMAYTGAEALRRVEEYPDLILLDRKLPDMEGLEICQQIRENEKLKSTPIIILSACDASEEKVKGLHVGADDYITKPFDNDDLLARVEAVLRRYMFSQKDKEEVRILVGELKQILEEELIEPFSETIFLAKSSNPLATEMIVQSSLQGILSKHELLFKAALAFGKSSGLEILYWQKGVQKWKEEEMSDNHKLFLRCTPHFIENNSLDATFCSHLDVDPQRLMVGLTEMSAIRDRSVFHQNLEECKNLGVSIGLDDVGSPEVSADLINDIVPDFVKIRASLIHQINQDPFKCNMVKAIVKHCQSKKIQTFAKGVENMDDYNVLLALGIHAVQGKLFSNVNE